MADFLFGTANAKAGVIRFGLKGPAGTHCVSINNPAFDRSFVAEVVISAGEANTDVVKEVAFSGQTGDTLVTTDTKGWTLAICLMAGSDRQATAGWQTNSTSNKYESNELDGYFQRHHVRNLRCRLEDGCRQSRRLWLV